MVAFVEKAKAKIEEAVGGAGTGGGYCGGLQAVTDSKFIRLKPCGTLFGSRMALKCFDVFCVHVTRGRAQFLWSNLHRAMYNFESKKKVKYFKRSILTTFNVYATTYKIGYIKIIFLNGAF